MGCDWMGREICWRRIPFHSLSMAAKKYLSLSITSTRLALSSSPSHPHALYSFPIHALARWPSASSAALRLAEDMEGMKMSERGMREMKERPDNISLPSQPIMPIHSLSFFYFSFSLMDRHNVDSEGVGW